MNATETIDPENSLEIDNHPIADAFGDIHLVI